jgi:predicted DCC family thiol-disulfide oxidoreductase YuxK
MNANIKNTSIILFDGECEICNGSIRFIQSKDNNNTFKYVPLNSDEGSDLLRQFGNKASKKMKNLDTLVLIESDKLYFKSIAALRIFRNLKGLWKLPYLFIFILPYIRDFLYDIISHNRHKLSGKASPCLFTAEK